MSVSPTPKQRPGRRLRGPRLFAIGLLALSLVVLAGTFQIRQGGGYSAVGPRVFPLAVAIGLLALSLIFLLRTTVFPDEELAGQAAAEEAMTHWPTIGLVLLLLIVYAFALRALGYIIATTLFFTANAWTLGDRARRANLARDLVIGLALSVVVYIGFTRFLGVRLPAGLLDFLL
ncbi:MAG TPA: tripartite tricarboxylate transporter TctB family protein [Caldilineaceae bacterium]|nr:tripartite tricarboxylate transporter TctB family protein [Caldilineaceae bacterium]